MKRFRNENNTMSLYVGKFYDILDNFDRLTNGCEHYFFGTGIPYWYAQEHEFVTGGSNSLALLVDCHSWTLVDDDERMDVIKNNELKLVKEFTMPTNPYEWIEALSEFTKVGRHGVEAEDISQLLTVYGNGQPCTLIDGRDVKNLGVYTVSKAKAEALLHMGIMPIPCFCKSSRLNIESLMESLHMWKNESWGLHDHKGSHHC